MKNYHLVLILVLILIVTVECILLNKCIKTSIAERRAEEESRELTEYDEQVKDGNRKSKEILDSLDNRRGIMTRRKILN